jgi:sugar phosphate isomerase/epimerase
MTGYDGPLSIEHEDSLMTPREGLEKAIRFLQEIALREPKGKVTWA